MKRMTIALITALLFTAPASVLAAGPERVEPPGGLKFVDIVFVRPFTMVGSFASTGVALGLMPLAFPIGLGDELVQYMIVTPWRFTANRYLGDFRNYEDGGTATGFGIRD